MRDKYIKGMSPCQVCGACSKYCQCEKKENGDGKTKRIRNNAGRVEEEP